jgi:hypothetical protein
MQRRVRRPLLSAVLGCGLVAVCGALLGPPASATKVYVWYDAEGTPHYSDQPRPGAKEIEIQSAQGYSAPAARDAAAARPAAPGTTQPRDAAPANPYTRVEIVQPAGDESFVNTSGRVDVVAVIEPGLAPGHLTWFLLDGVRQADIQNGATQATLEVSRGSHTLRIQITDQAEHEIASSAPVTFHVRTPTVPNPPVGPTLRKPPPQP